MKVKVSVDAFLSALPQKPAKSRVFSPSIVLSADGDRLVIEGAGFEDAFSVFVPAEVEEPGVVAVDEDMLKKLLVQLKGSIVEFSHKDGQGRVVISATPNGNESVYKLPCYNTDGSNELIGSMNLDDAQFLFTIRAFDLFSKKISTLQQVLDKNNFIYAVPNSDDSIQLLAIQDAIVARTFMPAEVGEGWDGIALPTRMKGFKFSALSKIVVGEGNDYVIAVNENGFIAYRTRSFDEVRRIVSQAVSFFDENAAAELTLSVWHINQFRKVAELASASERKRHALRFVIDFETEELTAFLTDFYGGGETVFRTNELPATKVIDQSRMPSKIIMSAELLSLALKFITIPEKTEVFSLGKVPVIRMTHGSDAVVFACMVTDVLENQSHDEEVDDNAED